MLELRSRLAALRATAAAGPLGDAVATVSRALRPLARAWRVVVGAVRGVAGPPAARVAHGMRAARDVLRAGDPPLLYRDGMVTLDRRGVVVSRYYMPFGRRRIPYASIREVRDFPLTRGRTFRVHGWSPPRFWLHHDQRRGERGVGLLLVTDGWLQPVLTPIDVTACRALLAARVAPASPTDEPARRRTA